MNCAVLARPETNLSKEESNKIIKATDIYSQSVAVLKFDCWSAFSETKDFRLELKFACENLHQTTLNKPEGRDFVLRLCCSSFKQ